MPSNTAIHERLHEVSNTGDRELVARTIDEIVAPDAIIHTPLPFEATGAQLLKDLFDRLLTAYPDLHIEIQDVIAAGDKVVSRNRVTGTHQGEYLGAAPTGLRGDHDEIVILRFEDGRIAETWANVDVLGQMRQLGLIAAPGAG